jgi:glycosyltransferase involved in cell wall biosynthesis
VRIAIANFGPPVAKTEDFTQWWSAHPRPVKPPRNGGLFDYTYGWGFHIFALGLFLMERDQATEVEFWDFREQRRMFYHASGVLWIMFHHLEDVRAYVNLAGPPDLFINHGILGHQVLSLLEGKCFRVHIPALRTGLKRQDNHDAECYLVDDPRFLDQRSMLYVPVVNTKQICPGPAPKRRDFIYLANVRPGKRHDILLRAVRGTDLTGHLHPVKPGELDLSGTRITTSAWDEQSVPGLLQSSRIAVYPGDQTSSPAALWECVAAGLPIVVNEEIQGGRHVVVPGVTGELARPERFREVMQAMLATHNFYRPRAYLEENWDTVRMLEAYCSFFRRMGWGG